MRFLRIMVLLGFCYLQNVSAQSLSSSDAELLSSYLQFDDSSPFSCLITYLPPFFLQNGLELKTFIRSKTFHRIRDKFGDIRAVDAVYVRAMKLTNNNTAVALLLVAVATIDHRMVGIKIPVFNLYFPLSNESLEEFAQRVNNLPAQLYSDTPRSRLGDKDKLQHFFGSAFLTFICESSQSADRVGEFVEIEEEKYIIGGVNDERDIRANRQGQKFGLALLEDNHRLPSEFLVNPMIAK
jgi:hypothetical protein